MVVALIESQMFIVMTLYLHRCARWHSRQSHHRCNRIQWNLSRLNWL